MWPVVLGAAVLGFVVGELNDGGSFASIGRIAQTIADYLVR
jgi:hypothetical protein